MGLEHWTIEKEGLWLTCLACYGAGHCLYSWPKSVLVIMLKRTAWAACFYFSCCLSELGWSDEVLLRAPVSMSLWNVEGQLSLNARYKVSRHDVAVLSLDEGVHRKPLEAVYFLCECCRFKFVLGTFCVVGSGLIILFTNVSGVFFRCTPRSSEMFVNSSWRLRPPLVLFFKVSNLGPDIYSHVNGGLRTMLPRICQNYVHVDSLPPCHDGPLRILSVTSDLCQICQIDPEYLEDVARCW